METTLSLVKTLRIQAESRSRDIWIPRTDFLLNVEEQAPDLSSGVIVVWGAHDFNIAQAQGSRVWVLLIPWTFVGLHRPVSHFGKGLVKGPTTTVNKRLGILYSVDRKWCNRFVSKTIYLSINQSVYLSIYLSISLPTYLMSRIYGVWL
jgi:hypothetical protein